MVSAIILAAGVSRRMGGHNKLLLPWMNKPLIAHAVESALASSADEVLVVIGFQGSLIHKALKDYPVLITENKDYAQGMLSSIKTGIQASASGCDGWMICLGDQPRISGSTLEQLINVFRREHDSQRDLIVLPVCGEMHGNPVIFSSTFRKRLLSHQGEGAREIVLKHEQCVVEVEVASTGMFEDIDTNEDYALLNEFI